MKKNKTIKTLRIEEKTMRILDQMAKEQNRSLNNLIETILMRFVEERT